MELAKSVLDDLSIAGDSSRIPDACFTKLVKAASEGVLSKDHRDAVERLQGLQGVEMGAMKAAYSALATLLLEAARHDCQPQTLGSVLEECKFTGDRINSLTDIFMVKKPFLQILLGNIGSSPPHIVDVDWRLDYYIKNNHLDKVNEPVYTISLKTEVAGSSELQEVQFACTLDQLEDLVGKLKDATKCVEKVSQL